MSAAHFEAKLYALRKSKDGLIVSFVVHPSDTPNDLITAPIGEQYIVALAPYVETSSRSATIYNDEGSTGLKVTERELRESPSVSGEPHERNGSSGPEAEGVTPKERYAAMDEGDKAVVRAGILADDPQFANWAVECGFDNEVVFIRKRCGVKSRAEISSNPVALAKFRALETEFLMATGKMASPS